MIESDYEKISKQLLCAGNKAVRTVRYLLRRAWGKYYAIWALSIFLFIYIPNFLNQLTSTLLQDVAFSVSYGSIIVVSSYLTGLTFEKVARTAKLQKALYRYPRRNLKDIILRNAFFVAILILVVLLATGFFRTFFGLFLEAVILAMIPVYIYRGVLQSLGIIPFEANLAIGSFIFSDVGSALSVILTRSAYYYPEFWVPTMIMWFMASILSFANAGDDLINNINQEECN
ncbi:hypothetical protein ApAK_05685 [Thermoplasmatales archaeon AK]|nr:hypothetical protein [Thermoplasmatales archaeon AK]